MLYFEARCNPEPYLVIGDVVFNLFIAKVRLLNHARVRFPLNFSVFTTTSTLSPIIACDRSDLPPPAFPTRAAIFKSPLAGCLLVLKARAQFSLGLAWPSSSQNTRQIWWTSLLCCWIVELEKTVKGNVRSAVGLPSLPPPPFFFDTENFRVLDVLAQKL